MIGTLQANRYRIERKLDEGGMQEVFVATDLAFERLVAVKRPKTSSATKRFQETAILSASVRHPNVAQTLDYIPGDVDLLVEELVPGNNLKQKFDLYYTRLDPYLAAHIFHHLARGVAASHHALVWHRDLKPSNIIVSDDWAMSTIKITDFGIAKMADEEIEQSVKSDTLTTNSTAIGALPYMSPEMIVRSAIGAPTDIWSLGAIMYHLLTGSYPFGSGLQAVPKILNRTLKPRSEIEVPPSQFKILFDELWALIEECLSLAPENRPTAAVLSTKLSNLCYSCDDRKVGTIHNYRTQGHPWGFIISEGDQFFFHSDNFYGRNPENGMRVSFASFPGDPRARAFPVLPLRPQSD